MYLALAHEIPDWKPAPPAPGHQKLDKDDLWVVESQSIGWP